MTIAVGLVCDDGVVLATDSCLSLGDDRRDLVNDKIVDLGGWAIAGAGESTVLQYVEVGLARMPEGLPENGDQVRAWAVATLLPAVRKIVLKFAKKSGTDNTGGVELLCAVAGRIVVVNPYDGVHVPVRPYVAVGIGAPYAMGALWRSSVAKPGPLAEIEATRAVEAACEFSSACSLPVRTLWIPE